MYLLLLLGLLLSHLAPAGGGPPPGLPGRLLWLGGVLAALAAWGWLAGRRLSSLADRDQGLARLLRFHSRGARAYRVAGLAAYAVLLFNGQWPDLVDSLCPTRLWLPRHLLVLAPFLLIVLVMWWGSFTAAVVVRSALARRDLSPPGPALNLRSYLVFQTRQYLLVLLVPYVFVLGCRDVAFLAVPLPGAEDAALTLAVLAVYVLSPVVLRVLWHTEALPPGPLRDRLAEAARRAGVALRDIVLWRTQGMMVNAAMTGLGRPLRYVFLSDALVDGLLPVQVEAVFGHELGHARYRHIPFFLLVAVGSLLLLALMEFLLQGAGWPDWLFWTAVGAFLLLYWGGFFGYLSRRFERQSDIAGARLVSCPGHRDPAACQFHHPDRPADPDLICPYQAWALMSALERIAALGGASAGARSWRHFGIGRRLDYLAGVVGRPDLVRRYDRRLRLFKIAFLVGVIVLGTAELFALFGLLLREFRGPVGP